MDHQVKEVLPNAAMPLATDFGLRLVFVVLFISSLSFLGLGVQPPAGGLGQHGAGKPAGTDLRLLGRGLAGARNRHRLPSRST